MCDGGVFSVPITMAILSAATAMYTQNEQRKMQQEAATTQLETQMQQQEYEKAVRQDTANLENAKGIAERDKAMRAAQLRLGEQTSMLAAGGFELSSGSNVSMLADSAREAQYEADVMTSEINARNWQNQVGVSNADNQLSLLATQKDNVNNGPDRLALGTTLIGGLTSAAGSAWGAYKGR